ncbi:hypothetical protein [Bacteroides sp.]|uniref:hypothetical protein n=1 Tax=Bacteroides sp. TaxID=29523 RepID=UPI00261B93AF|nr:hypothetical protein [Bacteroides sp.]MDD3040711.1 hypothetical protein [Bacteroides sp.]
MNSSKTTPQYNNGDYCPYNPVPQGVCADHGNLELRMSRLEDIVENMGTRMEAVEKNTAGMNVSMQTIMQTIVKMADKSDSTNTIIHYIFYIIVGVVSIFAGTEFVMPALL